MTALIASGLDHIIDLATFNARNVKKGSIRDRCGISADAPLISTCGIFHKGDQRDNGPDEGDDASSDKRDADEVEPLRCAVALG